MTSTDADIRNHVTTALQAGEGAQDFDVDGIVSELVSTYNLTGPGAITFDEIDEAEFWGIVAKYDTTNR